MAQKIPSKPAGARWVLAVEAAKLLQLGQTMQETANGLGMDISTLTRYKAAPWWDEAIEAARQGAEAERAAAGVPTLEELLGRLSEVERFDLGDIFEVVLSVDSEGNETTVAKCRPSSEWPKGTGRVIRKIGQTRNGVTIETEDRGKARESLLRYLGADEAAGLSALLVPLFSERNDVAGLEALMSGGNPIALLLERYKAAVAERDRLARELEQLKGAES